VKISKITPQKKHKNRCSLYVDGDFLCGLSLDIVTKYDLHEDDEITQDEIETLLLQEEKMKIRNRAYRLLSYRNRSTQEITQRLLEKGFDKTLVDEIINEFLHDQILDDERFVHAFVHDYTHVTPRGNVYIQNELRKKGVPQELIDKELSCRDERAFMLQFIKHKLFNLSVEDPKQRQKLIRRLLNRGFSSTIVYDTIRQLQDNHEKH
jgi:regulatory protein